jgi:hypothetical protein
MPQLLISALRSTRPDGWQVNGTRAVQKRFDVGHTNDHWTVRIDVTRFKSKRRTMVSGNTDSADAIDKRSPKPVRP